jgi:hypothetical protein
MALTPPFDPLAGQDSRRFFDGGVVPDDWRAVTFDTDLTDHVVGLYVGAGGNISVYMCQAQSGSSPVTIVGAVTGSIIPGRFRVVNSAGTTASNLMALLFL